MPIRKLTQQELKERLGDGIVIFGPKPLSQSPVSSPDLNEQSFGKPLTTEVSERSGDIAKQSNRTPKGSG